MPQKPPKSAEIRIREVSSTARLGEGNQTTETGRSAITVTMPDKCASCLGEPETHVTLSREEGVAEGVAKFATGATAVGAAVNQRFLELDVPICNGCLARYQRRGNLSALAFVLPVLGLLVALIATQRGVVALLCIGWMLGPGIAIALAHKLGAFRPGRLAKGGLPRFHNRTFQREYDEANDGDD